MLLVMLPVMWSMFGVLFLHTVYHLFDLLGNS